VRSITRWSRRTWQVELDVTAGADHSELRMIDVRVVAECGVGWSAIRAVMVGLTWLLAASKECFVQTRAHRSVRVELAV
jgi:hypothetical protein